MRKKPSDEAFRVSVKFPRRGWDQRLADLNSIIIPWCHFEHVYSACQENCYCVNQVQEKGILKPDDLVYNHLEWKNVAVKQTVLLTFEVPLKQAWPKWDQITGRSNEINKEKGEFFTENKKVAFK